jgi:hypothetical protein
MKPLSLIALFCGITLVTTTCLARPKKEKPPKQNIQQIIENEQTSDDDESAEDILTSDHPYRPNPVVMAGVGAIMNGALQIAQNPHSRPNLGHSIASMIHGIMTIIVEKIAKRDINLDDSQAVEECLRELSLDLGEEITEIIITKKL